MMNMNVDNSHIFHVAEDSDWLVLNVDFGTNLATWRFFLLRDPLGRLRYQHLDVNSPRVITIHRNPLKTSMNGVAGDILAGEWRIDFLRKLDFKLHFEFGKGSLSFKYRPNIPDPVRDIWANDFDNSGRFLLNGYDWEASQEEGSRWYKGDCHLHTSQSDGCLTPDQLNRQAQESRLDFIVVTDHIIVPTSWPKTDLLVIPGTEVTTRGGHWNALGPKRWIDFNPNLADGGMASEEGMNRVIRDASDSGAVCSISHPMYEGFEWTFHKTDLNQIDAVEIINAPWAKNSPIATEQALIVWNTLWNEGYCIAGIGGSDFHFNEPYYNGGSHPRVGSPTTCVYSHQLSANGILNNIRARHVYVTRGPGLKPSIQIDGKSYLPGDDLTEAIQMSAEGIVNFRIQVSGMTAGKLYWILNGKKVQNVEVSDDGTFEISFVWKDIDYVWARAEIHSDNGELLGFTNPIYSGSKTPEIRTWEQALVKSGFEVPVLKKPGGAGW